MEAIITRQISYAPAAPSIFSRFFNWCQAQQPNRLLWLAFALAGHGCVFTPITMMCVLWMGANLGLFMIAMSAMGLALVTNLAAMPTKVTIPALFLSLLVDLGVIITAVVTYA